MKKLGFFFLEFTPCTVLSEHFDASETWHDQIKVKEMEEIITISLQTKNPYHRSQKSPPNWRHLCILLIKVKLSMLKSLGRQPFMS